MCSGRVYHSYVFQSCFIYITYTYVYARTRAREGVNTGGLILFKCDGGLVLGRGGGGERMSTCLQMRGIALLCVQKMNHHTFQKIAMQLNRVTNQLRSCVAKLLRNLK